MVLVLLKQGKSRYLASIRFILSRLNITPNTLLGMRRYLSGKFLMEKLRRSKKKMSKQTNKQKSMQRKIKKAIKSGNIKKVSQFDESGAGGGYSTEYSDAEAKLQIDNVLRNRIQLQYKLRKAHLSSQGQWAQIEALETIYKEYDEYLDKKKEYLPKWYGIPMPKKVLMNEILQRQHQWIEITMQRNDLMRGLKKVGFSDKQIEDIMVDAKYIKNTRTLKRMEKEYDDKQT